MFVSKYEIGRQPKSALFYLAYLIINCNNNYYYYYY